MNVKKHYICSYQNPDSSIKFFILSDSDFTYGGYTRFLLSRERIEFSPNLENEDCLENIEEIFQHLLDGTIKSKKEEFPNKSELEILYKLLENQGVNKIAYHKGGQKNVEINRYYPQLSRRIFHSDDLERAYRIRRFRERVITNPKHQHPCQNRPYISRQQY